MLLRRIAKSKGFDWLGIAIVIVCSIVSGYLFESLNTVTQLGGLSIFVPFGIISAISSCASLMSDRLVARLNNLGNWFGIVTVVTSGVIDYILGNHAAVFTYPLTFIIQGIAIHIWFNSDKYKTKKPLRGFKGAVTIILIIIAALGFSYWINSLGFSNHGMLFGLTVLVFASSLIANALNAMKLTLQWPFWLFYNFIQLAKSLVQFNWANVGKYVYYIINSFAGLALWNNRQPEKV